MNHPEAGKDCLGLRWVCRGMLQEMESVLTKARMFKDKPDGDVTHMTRRDKNGVPIPVFQDPIHYPHQTMFLAPGKPAWHCHTSPPLLNRRGKTFRSMDSFHGSDFPAQKGVWRRFGLLRSVGAAQHILISDCCNICCLGFREAE